MTLDQVKTASLNDDVIEAVMDAVERNDWSSPATAPFKKIKHELSIDGILLRCNKLYYHKHFNVSL